MEIVKKSSHIPQRDWFRQFAGVVMLQAYLRSYYGPLGLLAFDVLAALIALPNAYHWLLDEIELRRIIRRRKRAHGVV